MRRCLSQKRRALIVHRNRTWNRHTSAGSASMRRRNSTLNSYLSRTSHSLRPMYTYGDPENPGYAAGFDLLFRGVEIATGGQRIHVYDQLIAEMKKRGLDPEKFRFYLQAFKYGMPPHGGFGLGLERLTAKLLGIENVKEATLFPRDLNRIDVRLSE